MDDAFIYLYSYNRLYKLNVAGDLVKTIDLHGLRPYFIGHGNLLYGIINNAKRIDVYNLDLELIKQIQYNDNYNKIYFNTNGSKIIFKHARFDSILII